MFELGDIVCASNERDYLIKKEGFLLGEVVELNSHYVITVRVLMNCEPEYNHGSGYKIGEELRRTSIWFAKLNNGL